MEQVFVGIDVAKDRMDVHVLPGGEVFAVERGVPQLSGFEVRPWNMKEFYIFDPHGNLLRFGCAPEEVGDAPIQGKRKAQ